MPDHTSKEMLTFTKEQAKQTIISINQSGRLIRLDEFMDDIEARLCGAIRRENYIPSVVEMTAEQSRTVVQGILFGQSLDNETACPCGKPCTFGQQLEVLCDDPDSVHAADIIERYLESTRYLQDMALANLIVIANP